MVVTEVGRSGTAMLLGGYGAVPGWIGVGSGSGLVSINNIILVYETDRNAITGSADTSVNKEVAWTSDFNSVEMSGTLLREFGLFNSGASNAGSLWIREGFSSVTFDGTNELQVQIRLSVF